MLQRARDVRFFAPEIHGDFGEPFVFEFNTGQPIYPSIGPNAEQTVDQGGSISKMQPIKEPGSKFLISVSHSSITSL